jgi:hypothetical protein
MRTKTNIFFGEGVKGFMQYLNKTFSAGNLAIVYDDKELAFDVLSHLDIALYKARLINLLEIKTPLPECVRFIIAIGGEKVINEVKKYSNKRQFCYYATEISYHIFSSTCPSTGESFDFAEFAYFDNSKLSIRDTEHLYSAYCNVFSVLNECILNSYYESNLPYTDKGLFGIIDSLKKFLLEGCDIDKYFSESLRLMKIGVEYLHTKGCNLFFSSRALSLGKLTKDYQFVIDYFVNMIVINFTKWNFFDMLIPAEKIILDVPILKPNYRGEAKGILLTKEELSKIACKVKNLSVLPNVEHKTVLKLIIDTVNADTPLMAEINNRGILEGMLNYG